MMPFYPEKTGLGCLFPLDLTLVQSQWVEPSYRERIFYPILVYQPQGEIKRVKESQETNPGSLDSQETKFKEAMICWAF